MENQISFKSNPNTISVQAKTKLPDNASKITIQEFLTFLTTAYQVQDTVEGVLMEGGKTEALNWLKMKESGEKNSYCQTSETNLQNIETVTEDLDKKDILLKKASTSCVELDSIKQKLNVVLSEGLLDSVLPYLVKSSSSAQKKNKILGIERVTNSNTSVHSAPPEKGRRKSLEVAALSSNNVQKTGSEIEIHVCDEIKNKKKTFVCNQKLLTDKMGYFSEITQGQKLEDMEISVHCDIGIFEWLMQWVKKESLLEEDWPKLDPQCVIPILVSAAFLQMDPLLNDCLLYCHQHLNEILRTTSNLSCLNDSVLTRLAAMYTNSEVETIRDRKDKIQSRIFTKLIQSLCEPDPESVRGHWYSLARIFRCEKCQQIIYPTFAKKIPCAPSAMRLQWDGSIISLHSRDPEWNINTYIYQLYKSLKTWRKVYWRLWGNTHFLYCLSCKRYFSVNQIGWCLFHPDIPQFFTLDAQKAPLPVGRYPCCGERAYRFDLLPNFSGCQFKQHLVCTKDVKDSAIFAMLEAYRHLIEEEPPQLLFPEKLTRLISKDSKVPISKDAFWWEGFEIIPPRPKLGMVSKFAKRSAMSMPVVQSTVSSEDESSERESSEEESSTTSSSSETSTEDASAECEISPKMEIKPNSIVVKPYNTRTSPRRKLRIKRKKVDTKLWQPTCSARTNQDNQRAFEEKVSKEMADILDKKTSVDCITRSSTRSHYQKNLTGGMWVRLEGEWKESLSNANSSRLRNIFTGKLKSRKYTYNPN